MVQAEHLLTVQNEIGESPIWHVAEQALYWADIENAEVHRFDPRTMQIIDPCLFGEENVAFLARA